MVTVSKCFVSISWVFNDFISLDFAEFGVVIGCDWSHGQISYRLRAYLASDYQEKFITCWRSQEEWSADSVEVSSIGIFQRIKEVALLWQAHQDQVARDSLFDILERYFPEQMALFGYQAQGCRERKAR